jgi:hypothetical protein
MRRSERISLIDAGALREHDHQPAGGKDRPRGRKRLRVGLATAHGKRPEAQEQPPQRALEQLHLGHVANLAAHSEPDEERVEEVLMVGSDDRRALGGNVLRSRDPEAKPQPQQDRREQAHERVQRPRDALLARVRVRPLLREVGRCYRYRRGA